MERKILYGNIKPNDVAHALMAEFNRGNLQAQIVGHANKLAVQISTSRYARSGGQTALTVSIQTTVDGVIIEIGQQAWMGVAASLGRTAFSALRNPFSLLGRLDDLAQDLEHMQLQEKVWKTIERAANALGASHELSRRLKRIACAYCDTANPLGEGSCIACGAPLGDLLITSCIHCGYALKKNELTCPNCRKQQ
ncbi:MAG: zinc ribbon domain-containing protein [Anaerolineales bacterium]|nr:zinc ribbon domain-containing protein [Anaerolineales bacterium]